MNDKLKEEIRKTLGILKNGGVILYPTDTIWGLGCDATNPEAVKRIYDIKKRADMPWKAAPICRCWFSTRRRRRASAKFTVCFRRRDPHRGSTEG